MDNFDACPLTGEGCQSYCEITCHNVLCEPDDDGAKVDCSRYYRRPVKPKTKPVDPDQPTLFEML